MRHMIGEIILSWGLGPIILFAMDESNRRAFRVIKGIKHKIMSFF